MEEPTAAEAKADIEMMAVLTGEMSVEDALGLETPAAEEAKKTTPDQPIVEGAEQPAAEAGKEATPPEPAKADAEKQAEVKEPVPVVLAKDGEHTIPYSVLEGLREQVGKLTNQLEETKKTGIAENLATIPKYSQEDLAIAKEEMPEIAAALETLMAERKALADKLANYEADAETKRQAEATAKRETAQAAIDSIPKLAHIQANNPNLFDEAVKIDEILRSRPENATLSTTARFQKAVDAVEIMFGAIVVPDAGSTPVAPAPATPAATPATPTAVKPLPDKAALAVPVPNSLSDLPAGSPPLHDPLSALSAQGAPGVVNHFLGRTPAEIADMVSNLI